MSANKKLTLKTGAHTNLEGRMDYFLTEEQAMIRDLARQIAEEKIVPVRRELDEKEEFPF